MTDILDISLLALLVVTAIGMLTLENLFGVVMLSGAYSLLFAALFTALDAVDVAFTEAAVGAGVSTVLMLSALSLTASRQTAPSRRLKPAGALAVLGVGGLLVYGGLDLPAFGRPDAPAHSHVSNRYILESQNEIGVPNMVTAVLASYRGYDTLGETVVIFAAGVAVLLLLGKGRRKAGSNAAQGQSR